MNELQELNPVKDTATDAQIMFLVLNTAGITLIPTSVIAIRQTIALEQHVQNFNAADIFLPTLIATFIAFMSGMIIVALFQRINLFKLPVILFVLGFGGLIALLHYTLSQLPADRMNQSLTAAADASDESAVVLAHKNTACSRGVSMNGTKNWDSPPRRQLGEIAERT